MKFTWGALKEFLILAIGITLVIFLNDIQNKVEEGRHVNETAIAGDCRVLLALDEPLSPKGPCFWPEIREIWEPLHNRAEEVKDG